MCRRLRCLAHDERLNLHEELRLVREVSDGRGTLTVAVPLVVAMVLFLDRAVVVAVLPIRGLTGEQGGAQDQCDGLVHGWLPWLTACSSMAAWRA